MKIMLDSNIYDEIVATPGLTDTLHHLHAKGQVEIVKTHIQDDELRMIPDKTKRDLVKKVPGNKVITEGAIWDVTRWDEGTYGSGSGDIKIENIQKGNPKHSEDALIAATAAVKVDVLVTNEKRLPKRIAATGSRVDVWNFDQFTEYINALKQSNKSL